MSDGCAHPLAAVTGRRTGQRQAYDLFAKLENGAGRNAPRPSEPSEEGRVATMEDGHITANNHHTKRDNEDSEDAKYRWRVRAARARAF